VWRYNPAGAPAGFTDTASAVARLGAAFDKWSAVCAVSQSYQGTTATAPNNTPGDQPDQSNVVGWAPLQGNTAGLTWTWYSSPGGTPRLIDGDIILSPTLVTGNGQMDRVAVHEWGHLIGLAHSNMNQTAMSGPPYSATTTSRCRPTTTCAAAAASTARPRASRRGCCASCRASLRSAPCLPERPRDRPTSRSPTTATRP
jgi:hypothetical protein